MFHQEEHDLCHQHRDQHQGPSLVPPLHPSLQFHRPAEVKFTSNTWSPHGKGPFCLWFAPSFPSKSNVVLPCPDQRDNRICRFGCCPSAACVTVHCSGNVLQTLRTVCHLVSSLPIQQSATCKGHPALTSVFDSLVFVRTGPSKEADPDRSGPFSITCSRVTTFSCPVCQRVGSFIPFTECGTLPVGVIGHRQNLCLIRLVLRTMHSLSVTAFIDLPVTPEQSDDQFVSANCHQQSS